VPIHAFPRPAQLHGRRLAVEIQAAGYSCDGVFVYEDGHIEVVTDATKAQAQAVLTSHSGAPLADEANGATLRQRADAALAANATYLAISSPTAAQNAAQVQRLTKECSALVRLVLGRLHSIDGTRCAR
jgi:hypothetical protein